ncbi:hypothetical protein PENTCL1PPCAC_22562 [Pristionchus entomophagus]|uniref:tRNA-dihydrouridine(16/17) synthase [NAD(P)(+)] n=1 Tax=Pristionchus entomophagus TaxID=358040 RepID=A0AAV5U1M8_9BILA|nr:hypothetical protein PENTCL1PPCAC_22562 [Pristionchus entomophagus]
MVDSENGAANASSSVEQVYRIPKTETLGELTKCSTEEIEAKKLFWTETLDRLRIKNVVAPMVDQSELAFRMMMRAHGAQLTYTPMIHAHLFTTDTTYRKNILSTYTSDRPVIVQFCGNDPNTIRDACRLVEGKCDGVDLNLGCPQNVAKRGHYGSYLQDEVDLICSILSAVRDYCKLPISAKIRIREDREQTKEYARRLVNAGATMLTVHGRTREMKGVNTGLADWTRIREVVEVVDVPVIANGNIQMGGDVDRCMTETGAKAVMAAEGILYNPYLFEGTHPVSYKVALEYLEYASKYDADVSAVRAHLFRICQYSLLEHDDLRQKISLVHTVEKFREAIDELGRRVEELREMEESRTREEDAANVYRDVADGVRALESSVVALTPHWLCKPYIRLSDLTKEKEGGEGLSEKEKKKEKMRVKAAESGLSVRQMKKKDRRALQAEKTIKREIKEKFPICSRCGQPCGQSCKEIMCKKCCRWTCRNEHKDCNQHKYKFSHLLTERNVEKGLEEEKMDEEETV